ncbi:polyketide synthase dehydratase domain-containing protein [Streptomyces albus]|nr:polyketide synthase dehydratase domain-containing protein [Streptomyces albus]
MDRGKPDRGRCRGAGRGTCGDGPPGWCTGRLPRLDELHVQAPLVVPADGPVDVQVRVQAGGAPGKRHLEVLARRVGQQTWDRHAAGILAPARPVRDERLEQWPPPGAAPVEPARELEHGPSSGGLRALWRGAYEGEVFAETCLSGEAAEEAGRYLLHPGLFEALLHAASAAELLPACDGEPGFPCPSPAWRSAPRAPVSCGCG